MNDRRTTAADEPVLTTTVPSPIGALTLTAIQGSVVGLYMHDQRHAPTSTDGWMRDDAAFKDVVAQLDAYFAGELELRGTPFQRRVWAGLLEIPYGETISYGELAQRIGRPKAFRAVGLANGRNPVAVIVPCHRVVAGDGTLGGYGGGLDRKAFLLDLERRRRV